MTMTGNSDMHVFTFPQEKGNKSMPLQHESGKATQGSPSSVKNMVHY
jgi:hypothetical protein